MGWIRLELLRHPWYRKLARNEQYVYLILVLFCDQHEHATGTDLVPLLVTDVAHLGRRSVLRLVHTLDTLCAQKLATSETIDSVTYYRAKPPDDLPSESQRHSALSSGREGDGGEMGTSSSRKKSRRDFNESAPSLTSPKQEDEASSSSRSRAKSNSKSAAEILLWWNALCEKLGSPRLRFITVEREKKFAARSGEVDALFDAIEIEARLVGSWAREKGFITFDWLMNPKNLTKFLEGNYREKAAPTDRDADMDFIRQRYGNAESV